MASLWKRDSFGHNAVAALSGLGLLYVIVALVATAAEDWSVIALSLLAIIGLLIAIYERLDAHERK